MKSFEKDLPENYRLVKTVDAKSTKVSLLLTLGSLVLTAALVVLAYVLIRPKNFAEEYSFLRNILFCVTMFAYIVLHELVHGIAYKLLTKQKLTFGLTLTVAYCGVPDIYVYRRTALIALLAPFVVFDIAFLLPAFLLPNQWDAFYAAVIFAFHFGGCVGDLYDTFLYLFRFRDPQTLMRDTGPAQSFYLPEENR